MVQMTMSPNAFAQGARLFKIWSTVPVSSNTVYVIF